MSGQVLTSQGGLHRFVNVYLNDDDVRYLDSSTRPWGRTTSCRSSRLSPAASPERRGSRTVAAYESILDLIGNTPLVDVSSLSPNPAVGSTSSSKDRTRAAR